MKRTLLALACTSAMVLGHDHHHDHDHHDHHGHDHHGHDHHDHHDHGTAAAAAATKPVHPEIPQSLLDRIDFLETFQDGQRVIDAKWHLSTHPRYSEQEWKVDVEFGAPVAFSNDQSLSPVKRHKHYGLVHQFEFGEFDNTNRDLVFQYEVRFHGGSVDCSGAYVKLLRKYEGELTEQTPYVVMFGPDKCGKTNKVHLIVQQKQPSLNTYEEKHMTSIVLAKASDSLSHLYTLVIRKDNSFSVLVDLKEMASGNLLTPSAFEPSFGGAKEMDDPQDSKPADWVEVAKIPDPTAFKPEEWDELAPKTIADPDAKQPADWNAEDDGEWEASQIPNPEYRGIWKAPIIDNPDYKGEWKPKRIPNPHYFVDETPSNLEPIRAVAFEILANDGGIAFDNLLLGHDEQAAKEFAELTFVPKQAAEIAAVADVKRIEAKADRLKKLNEGGLVGMLTYLYGEGEEYFMANRLVVVSTIAVIILSLASYVFYFTGVDEKAKDELKKAAMQRRAEAAHEAAKTAAVDDEEEEEDENEEEEEEGTKAE
ncbi:hypothetical protein BASA81_002005 [Batrachochytrium salamandrivorans]|nr:hypothetical protein BASA81_002005 [Batrachochytrium salamandrivorans]